MTRVAQLEDSDKGLTMVGHTYPIPLKTVREASEKARARKLQELTDKKARLTEEIAEKKDQLLDAEHENRGQNTYASLANVTRLKKEIADAEASLAEVESALEGALNAFLL